MQNFLLEAAAPQQPGMLEAFWPIGLMIAFFYFVLIRPNKKKEKAATEMRNQLEIGDEVATTGGIIGRVVSVRDDTILIESGADNTKLRVAKWAIQANLTGQERMRDRQIEAAKAKEKAKEEGGKKKKSKSEDE